MVIDRITSQAAGFRCRSDTNSTRIVDGSGRYAGSVDVTSYSRDTLVTSLASWSSYLSKSATMLRASPTTPGADASSPSYSGSLIAFGFHVAAATPAPASTTDALTAPLSSTSRHRRRNTSTPSSSAAEHRRQRRPAAPP